VRSSWVESAPTNTWRRLPRRHRHQWRRTPTSLARGGLGSSTPGSGHQRHALRSSRARPTTRTAPISSPPPTSMATPSPRPLARQGRRQALHLLRDQRHRSSAIESAPHLTAPISLAPRAVDGDVVPDISRAGTMANSTSGSATNGTRPAPSSPPPQRERRRFLCIASGAFGTTVSIPPRRRRAGALGPPAAPASDGGVHEHPPDASERGGASEHGPGASGRERVLRRRPSGRGTIKYAAAGERHG
jgi:hypothetical protein